MSKRVYLDFINDINDEILNIEEFVDSLSYEDFIGDKKTLHAVIRCFEVIGEAVKNIPTEIRNEYPDIPWKEMAGMRDKLIHEYFGIDYEILWKTIKHIIPEIKSLLKIAGWAEEQNSK
ncbi:MAG: DUF86 domain-containing protein [Candidatus Poribacteria bacterium]